MNGIKIDLTYKDKYPRKVIQLLDLYELFPFHLHPLWVSIINGNLTKQQIINAEIQHYLRTKAGQPLRKEAMEYSKNHNRIFYKAIDQTYIEECTLEDGTPTHLELIIRLIESGGVYESEFSKTKNTPGNIAAISIYKDIADRGAGCHIIGAGAVEYFYSQICKSIFDSYVNNYDFAEDAAITYSLHSSLDLKHAERAFDALDEAEKVYGWETLENSVRDAFIATSLHYDGMYQAAVKTNSYWNGKS